jgi:CubicO group peptidase (beta-lactamase class C family)
MAGKSYEQFVSERILGPLGLKDLSIVISLDQQGQLAPGTRPMAM